MHTRKAVGVAVGASVVVTSLVWLLVLFGFCELDRRVERTQEVSNVIAPMRMLVDDLNETARKGEHDILARKLQALRERWDAYGRGEDRPDGFCWSICNIGEKAPE